MEFVRGLSAKRMAVVSGLGGLLAASGFLLPSPRHMTSHPYYPVWVWATLMFGILLAGMAVNLAANSSLKEGIGNQRWSRDEVVSVQAVLGSPLWMVVALVLVLVSFAGMCLMALRTLPVRFNGLPYACLIVSQTISGLSSAVRWPRATGPTKAVWQGLARIRSEHWGER